MIKSVFKQSFRQLLKNLSSSRALHLSSAARASKKGPKKELHNTSKCDTGKCLRKDKDMKGAIDNMAEYSHLQPSRPATSQAARFKIARPKIDPEVQFDYERNCRQKEECKKLKESINEKTKNGKI